MMAVENVRLPYKCSVISCQTKIFWTKKNPSDFFSKSSMGLDELKVTTFVFFPNEAAVYFIRT